MKKFVILFITILYSLSNWAQTSQVEENLKKHVYYLASKELKGRDTGSPEIDTAAEYIRNFFIENQLSDITQHSYSQDFYLYAFSYGNTYEYNDSAKRFSSGILPLSKNPYKDSLFFQVQFVGYDNRTDFKVDSGALPLFLLDFTRNPETFAGDLARIAAKYKLDKLLFSIPADDKVTSRISFSKFSFTQFRSKKQFEQLYERYSFFHKVSKYLPDSLVAIFVPYYGYYHKFPNHDSKKDFKYYGGRKTDKLMKKIPIQKPRSYLIECNPQLDSMRATNIIATIEGKSKKDEYIIVGAHYDHVGEQHNGICVGADDNASGTASVMELAARMAKDAQNGNQPERSVMFILFSGEELGLLGAEHYVENPIVPLNKTIALINLDMVGRPDHHTGKFVHAKFHGPKDKRLKRITKRTARKMPDFNLDRTPGLMERIVYTFASDHFKFSQKGVRNMVLFTDDHKDYHTPTDTPDKINYANMAAIHEFLYQITKELASTKKF